jgi:hypothetical protein
LGERLELGERVGFTDSTDFVFDASRESRVELTTKSAIAVATDLGGEALELYDILVNTVSIPHIKLFELRLGVSLRVMRTEVLLELGHEFRVIVHP